MSLLIISLHRHAKHLRSPRRRCSLQPQRPAAMASPASTVTSGHAAAPATDRRVARRALVRGLRISTRPAEGHIDGARAGHAPLVLHLLDGLQRAGRTLARRSTSPSPSPTPTHPRTHAPTHPRTHAPMHPRTHTLARPRPHPRRLRVGGRRARGERIADRCLRPGRKAEHPGALPRTAARPRPTQRRRRPRTMRSRARSGVLRLRTAQRVAHAGEYDRVSSRRFPPRRAVPHRARRPALRLATPRAGAALLPPASCLLPPCLLPPASCLLPPASCLLPPASCLLPPLPLSLSPSLPLSSLLSPLLSLSPLSSLSSLSSLLSPLSSLPLSLSLSPPSPSPSPLPVPSARAASTQPTLTPSPCLPPCQVRWRFEGGVERSR